MNEGFCRFTSRRGGAGIRDAVVALGMFTVVAVGGLGCASGSKQARETSRVDYVERMRRAPLGEETVAAVRLQPDRFDEVVAASATSGSETEEGGAGASNRVLATLFESMTGLASALEGGASPLELKHLDRDRALYFALTERGNAEVLERLRDGVPMTSDDVFGGTAARLVLPATDPETLAGELRAYCSDGSPESRRGRCRSIATIDVLGPRRAVVVELLYGSEPRDGRFQAEPTERAATEPSGYLQRGTPAAKAFVGSGAGVALYAKSADFWRASLLYHLPRLLRQFDGASEPEKRRRFRRMYAGALRRAGAVAPRVREYEDAVWMLRGGEEAEAVAVDMVQTYTLHGRELVEGGRIDARLPTIDLQSPDLEVEWAYDVPGAIRRTSLPSWFPAPIRSEGMTPWESNSVHAASVWLRFPHAMMRRWSRSLRTDGPWLQPLRRLAGLRALRAKANVRTSADAPLGVECTAAVVADVSRASNLDATIEALVEVGKTWGMPLRMRTAYRDEEVRLRVTFDGAMQVFGVERPVGARSVLRLELSGVRSLLSRVREKVGGWRGMLGRITSAEFVEIQRTGHSTGRAVRVRSGDASLDERLRLPTADLELVEPESAPECFRSVVEESRGALLERGGAAGESPFGLYARIVPRLAARASECTPGGDYDRRLQRVVSENWEFLASLHEGFRHWSSAAWAYRHACELGDETACSREESAARAAERLQIPDVGRVPSLGEPLPRGVLELGREGARVGAKKLASLAGLDPDAPEKVRERIVGGIERWAGPYRMQTSNGRIYGVPLAVDATIPVGTVETVAQQIFEAEVDFDEIRRSESKAKVPREGETANGILFLVRTHRQHAAYQFGGAYHLGIFEEGDSTEPSRPRISRSNATEAAADLELKVRVGPGGFDVWRRGDRLEPVEGCPDEGPTICLSGARSEVTSALESYRRAHREDDREHVRVSSQRIAEAYPYLALHRLLREIYREERGPSAEPRDLDEVRLSVDDALPYVVLARTMAAVATQSWRDEVDSSAEFFADPHRTGRMFDRMHLELEESPSSADDGSASQEKDG